MSIKQFEEELNDEILEQHVKLGTMHTKIAKLTVEMEIVILKNIKDLINVDSIMAFDHYNRYIRTKNRYF